MPKKVITDEQKQEIKNYYLSQPMTLSQVANHFHLSSPTVGKILKDVPKYTKARINNPNLKESFFHQINDEASAYFLGFIIADGNVFNDGTGRQSSISITVNNEDSYILQSFKDTLQTNTSISEDGRGCNQIAVRSNIMATDLAQYGVVPRKSYNTYLPEIDGVFIPHLIRGIFDGDGSIQAKQTQNHNRFLHSISFCGTHQLMEDISNCLNRYLSLTQKPSVYDYKDRKLSEIKIQNKNDMYKFGEWIYSGASLYLIRKKETYNLFKHHYNLK